MNGPIPVALARNCRVRCVASLPGRPDWTDAIVVCIVIESRAAIVGTSAAANWLMYEIVYGPPLGPLTETLPLSAGIVLRLFRIEAVLPLPPVAGSALPLVDAKVAVVPPVGVPGALPMGLTFWPLKAPLKVTVKGPA